MITFNVRVDFFRDLAEAPKGYVGSALRDGLRAPVLPRVGEYVFGLGPPSVWRRGVLGDPYSEVAAIEHAPSPAFTDHPGQQEEREPSVTVVVRGLWRGDGPLTGEHDLHDHDRQGWRLCFFSDHTPIRPFPGQPLMSTDRSRPPGTR